MKTANYRPEIDGLRAIAVLGVVLFHAGLGVPGGYVGVDVFFVISGYLITGIILRSQDKKEFSLVNFWERRIRRIFPALTVMTLVTLGIGFYLLLPSELEELGKSSIAQVLFSANIYFWRDTGYFAGPSDLKPLLHTWSLAVEEQFYFFLPGVLVLLKKQGRERVFVVLLLGTVASFFISIYGAIYHASATFYLLPTRAWELAFGCLLAASPWKPISRPRFDNVIGLAGLAGIIGSMLLYTSQTRFPGLAALPPVAGAAAIIYAATATRDMFVSRLLSVRPLVFVGLISYSLYLWHWPVLVYSRYYFEAVDKSMLIIALGVSALVSVASWWMIEVPFRSKLLQSRRPLFASAMAINFLILVGSAMIVKLNGVPERFPADLLELQQDQNWLGDFPNMDFKDFSPEIIQNMGVEKADQPLDFILWGDSHARVVAGLVDEVAKDKGMQGLGVFLDGIPPVPNLQQPGRDGSSRSITFNQMFFDHIKKLKPRNILLVARWNYYCEGLSETELLFNKNLDPRRALVMDELSENILSPDESTEVLKRQLKKVIATSSEWGARVWIMRQVPETGEPQPARDFFLWRIGRRSGPPDKTHSREDYRARQRNPDRVFRALTQEDESVSIFDPSESFFDETGMTINYRDGRSWYKDDDHLTRAGVQTLRPYISGVLNEMREWSTAGVSPNK